MKKGDKERDLSQVIGGALDILRIFLPESVQFAIIDAEDIAGALTDLGYNVPHLIRVFEALKEKCCVRTAPGEIRVPSG